MNNNNTKSNDNSHVRSRYLGTDYNGSMSRLVPFIPTARKLIEKYCKKSFKNLPEHPDYSFLEYQLCTLLENPEYNFSHRELKISCIATVLECSPLLLHHDKNLPF